MAGLLYYEVRTFIKIVFLPCEFELLRLTEAFHIILNESN